MTDWSERAQAVVDAVRSDPGLRLSRLEVVLLSLLTEALAEREREVGERFLSWRGVDDPCKTCGGTGQRSYPNTSTWLRGIGGQAITPDVCDQCWGTGDEHRKGVDVRQKHGEMASLTAERDQLRERVASLARALHDAKSEMHAMVADGNRGFSCTVMDELDAALRGTP